MPPVVADSPSGTKRFHGAVEFPDGDDQPLLATPIRRQRLPIDRASEPATSGSSASLQLAADSPGHMARHARKQIKLPACIAVRTKPALADVSAGTFLSYLAGFYIQCNGLKHVRARIRCKQAALGASDILFALAAGNELPLPAQTPAWRPRQSAGHAAAALFGDHYSCSVRHARDTWKHLWKSCPRAVQDHWTLLLQLGYGVEKFRVPDSSLEDSFDASKGDMTCPGALFTWQTDLGRNSDVVQAWVQAGIGVEMLCELMQGDPFCQSRWHHFTATVEGLVAATDFCNWSCAMEVSTNGAVAVVHLHAYAGVDWNNYTGMASSKVTFCLDDWRYCGIKPHVSVTKVAKNICAKRALSAPLFYCMAPKWGTVFQYCSLTPGVDLLLADTRSSSHLFFGNVLLPMVNNCPRNFRHACSPLPNAIPCLLILVHSTHAQRCDHSCVNHVMCVTSTVHAVFPRVATQVQACYCQTRATPVPPVMLTLTFRCVRAHALWSWASV